MLFRIDPSRPLNPSPTRLRPASIKHTREIVPGYGDKINFGDPVVLRLSVFDDDGRSFGHVERKADRIGRHASKSRRYVILVLTQRLY